MNPKKLKAYMLLNGDDRMSLAQYLNLSPTSLSYKINESHGRCFDKKEIEAISERYNLTADEITSIFFESMVS